MDSDVDVYVLFRKSHFVVNTPAQAVSPKHTGGGYDASYFKQHLQNALAAKFGSDVKRGNKSFKIKENTYKHQTDVVCTFVAEDDSDNYTQKQALCGVCLFPDDGSGIVINYPEQDTANGKDKNARTSMYYKKMVRIFKCIRNDLNLNTPSFLIECLISNVHNNILEDNTKTYRGKVIAVADFLLRFLPVQANDFYEVNCIKHLFGQKQKWTANDAVAFLNAVKAAI
jgi:hypothetical protein